LSRRAVVTGGAGFVGSHLCGRLIADGWSVVCVDNFVTGTPDNVAHLAGNRAFELVEVDVSEELDIDGPVDAVLHFASPASPIDYLELPIETLKVGSFGTMHALDLARANKARFLMASTSEVYGDPLVHPQPESYWGNVNPIGPRAVYDEAKRFSEAITAAYRRYYDVNTAIVRIFNTYGPRMRSGDGRAVPNFVMQALHNDSVTVAGDGSQTRSLCYVEDLVDGLVRLLESDEAGPMNLGNPYELSMLELAIRIRDLAGSTAEPTFVPRPQDDPTLRRPDITQAQERLGWSPSVDLDAGLLRTIEWFRSSSELVGNREVGGSAP